MKNLIYDYKNYKSYINDRLSRPGVFGRGTRSKLAKNIGVQSAYVSRVLNGDAQFSLEQADLINEFLGHTQEESEFFLLLVQLERAGSKRLKNYFSSKIKQELEERLILKKRFKIKESLSNEDKAIYYSSWHFVAIHILISISEFQTKDAVSKKLNIPLKTVSEVLEFLISVGLAKEKEDRFVIGPNRIHLGSDSPHIYRHYTNWRTKALLSFDKGNRENLHYSSVCTVSEKDMLKIKSKLIENIEEINQIIADSKEEDIHILNLDFFRLQ